MTDAQRIQLLTDLLNDAVTQNRDLRAERDSYAADRDSLRTQLFETREQRDEARDDRRVFLLSWLKPI